jgi:flagellar assembly protein FliH
MPTILRATDQNMATASVAFNFDDMADQAKKCLDQVRLDAAKIVVQAQQEAATVRTQAQAQGRQAALAEVDQMIQRQLSTVIPALRQAILDIHQAKQAWLAQWETAGIHLAAEIARRLIRSELTRQPEIPLTLIREALQLAAGSGYVRLLLNPGDHQALQSQVQLLVQEMSGLGETQIIADASVSPGGCRVETRFGSIDQTFEAQLARVEEELRP